MERLEREYRPISTRQGRALGWQRAADNKHCIRINGCGLIHTLSNARVLQSEVASVPELIFGECHAMAAVQLFEGRVYVLTTNYKHT